MTTRRSRHKGKVPARQGASAREGNARKRYEETLRILDKKLKPLTDAIRESQQLSRDDFAIRINARD